MDVRFTIVHQAAWSVETVHILLTKKQKQQNRNWSNACKKLKCIEFIKNVSLNLAD